MKLLEYKAKELFEKYGIRTMRGCVVDSAEGMEKVIADANLSYPVVIKAQVQIGGRGKAGGIQFADNAKEAEAHCRRLLGSDLRGLTVRQLLIVEKASFKTEWYISIMLDRLTKCPMIIFSANGGMEIEQTAKEAPEKIVKVVIDPLMGFRPYMAEYMLSKSNLPLSYKKELINLVSKLYKAFMEYHCMLCEINPLVIADDDTLIALDGKVDIDDSALYKLPDMMAFREELYEEPLVREARHNDFLYIPVEEGGTVAVTSNGSGMLMSCIDLITKEGIKIGAALDLGGGATAERIEKAIRILFSTPGVKAVLINIFGGITRCDEVAGGVKLAMEHGYCEGKIIVVRMEGTNKEKGLEIINSLGGDIINVPGLRESVKALVDRRDRL